MPAEELSIPGAGNRWLTLVLAGLACIAVEVAVRGMHGPLDIRGFAAATAAIGGIAITVGELLRRRWPRLGAGSHGRTTWVCAAVSIAVAVEAVIRFLFGDGILLDTFLLIVLRDLVIALAVLSHHGEARQACVGVATFLVVFASASVHAIWAQGFVIAFATIGVCWLVAGHWKSIEQRIEASSRTALPRRWLLALPLALLGVLLAVPVSARQVRQANGFMPTSGGQGRSAAAATAGVGDGDALVAGLDNIRSFAPLDNAPFMTSHESSLYDIFDDTYNEPVKRKKTERTISLANQDTIRNDDHSIATSRRPGREFSTVRQPGRSSSRRIADLESRALLQVMGRVPLHLKLESFDRFDGTSWHPEELPSWQAGLSWQAVGSRTWLRVADGVLCDIYGPPEVHALRVIRLRSNRIPSPNRLAAVHIDHVDRADFFEWAQPGILRVDRDTLPELVTVNVQSQPVDAWRLVGLPGAFSGGPAACREFGEDGHAQAVKTLAESWVAGLPRGWRQIERVVERIRETCTLDPDARANADRPDSVAEFLLETRRGPDYLFASAAVVALRSLGYAARLATGFYAHPQRHDVRADHTAVLPSDVHFWAEVHAVPGHWITLEPTPGYTVLEPRRGVVARATRAVLLAVGWMVRQPLTTAALGLLMLLGLRHRKYLVDLADEAVWRLATMRGDGTASRAMVIDTVAFLDRRCARAGLPRPRHVTPARWLGIVQGRMSATMTAAVPAAHARAFVRIAEVALYGPPGSARLPSSSVTTAPAVWSWRHLASARRLTA
jgi:transglutaminase-like putative cysteine protease